MVRSLEWGKSRIKCGHYHFAAVWLIWSRLLVFAEPHSVVVKFKSDRAFKHMVPVPDTFLKAWCVVEIINFVDFQMFKHSCHELEAKLGERCF